jgi:predicted RNA methylase
MNTVVKYNKLAKAPYDKDIIPGVYEGGFKVWECTLDLLKYIAEVQTQINLNNINSGNISNSNEIPNSIIAKLDMRNKVVMDIGCGHGLLGIAALKSGASCCIFQDYNK